VIQDGKTKSRVASDDGSAGSQERWSRTDGQGRERTAGASCGGYRHEQDRLRQEVRNAQQAEEADARRYAISKRG